MKTYYSHETGGFYPKAIYGGGIPGDAIELAEGEHQRALNWIESGGVIAGVGNDGKVVLADRQAEPEPVPSEITMRQCRLVLHREQLLPMVQPAIDALEEPKRTEVQIEWDYASSVRRDSEVVFILAKGLGIEDSRLDDLFLAASKL